MNRLNLSEKLSFYVPKEGILQPNGPDDPLTYYYKPIIGYLYRARIIQSLSLLTPPYKSILELGYGSGVLLPTLCSIGNSVHGIDLTSDPQKIKFNLCKIGIDAELTRGDIVNLDYHDESFDLVVAISVIEHISDLSPVINKVFKLLCPGGVFLVGMPRVGAIFSKAFHLVELEYPIDKHHVTNYHQLLKAATECFDLVKFTNMPNFFPAFLGLYFSMLFRKPL